MRLSDHFTLAEFTRSAAATRLGLSNQPPEAMLDTLKQTAERMERVRALLGNRPLTITSAYRTAAVNRAAGGSPTSDHVNGLAVDFQSSHMTPRQMALEISASTVPFDQLIIYRNHLHIGFGRRMRRQFLDRSRI